MKPLYLLVLFVVGCLAALTSFLVGDQFGAWIKAFWPAYQVRRQINAMKTGRKAADIEAGLKHLFLVRPKSAA